EQDRASAVLTDHDELAWPSLGELPGRCESDWSDHNRDGLASAGGLRQGVYPTKVKVTKSELAMMDLHPHNFPDPTGLQVLKKCRVSGRRHFCHPTSFQGRGCENGR